MRIGRFAIVAATAAALSIGSAASAGAATITFDDLSGTGLVPSPYGGINWDGNWTYSDVPQDPFNPSSSPTRIVSNEDNYVQGVLAAVPFYFLTDGVFNGASVSGLLPVSFSLYSNGTLVHTTGDYNATSISFFVPSGYAGLVDEVRVNGYAGFYVLDDITYDPGTPIPEPASLLLLGSGLTLLALRRRRT